MSAVCWGCGYRALYYRGLVIRKLVRYKETVEVRCPGRSGTFVQGLPQRCMVWPVEEEQLYLRPYGPLCQDSIRTTGQGDPRDSLRGKILIQQGPIQSRSLTWEIFRKASQKGLCECRGMNRICRERKEPWELTEVKQHRQGALGVGESTGDSLAD